MPELLLPAAAEQVGLTSRAAFAEIERPAEDTLSSLAPDLEAGERRPD